MKMAASLDAMAWEANRRGITYGELVAHLKLGEDMEIERRYRQHQDEKRFKAAERAAQGEPSRRWRRKKKKEDE